MHISDGVLSLPVIAVGWGVTLTLLAITLWRSKDNIVEQIPKISVMTGAFFIASLIHIPIPPTSVHLILNGLLGVVLGVFAYPAMFIGLTLQALLFQHGGITTIGVNTMNVGVPALIAYGIFRMGCSRNISKTLLGAICGGLAVLITAVLLAVCLITTGDEFQDVAKVAVAAHIPIMVIELIITGSVVAFLAKVKPEMLPINKEDKRK
ncbi:cobalt transporter CbiM [Methanosarcinales archaeon]|nr:MAG: cobalt transporter CbiM [Methanosarcinales archaeon]